MCLLPSALHHVDGKSSRASRMELIRKCGRKSTSKAKTTDPDNERRNKSARAR